MNIFLDQRFKYAVVGASKNPEKYGNIVLKKLKYLGYDCVPIHPTESEIEGLRVFPSLDQCPFPIDVAVFILPPEKTKLVLPQLLVKNIRKVWFQPGSFDADILSFCEKNNIQEIHTACVMVEAVKK